MFEAVDIRNVNLNCFDAIGNQWMLITAGSKEHCNTMTASWGGMGVLWGKNVATVYIRPQRYTKEFIDSNNYFTLTFYREEYRQALNLCGTKSGRDCDKIKLCGLTTAEAVGGAPYFEQAELVLVCRKLYADTIKPESFLDRDCERKNYPEHDYHTLYIGEIVEALRKS